MKAKTRDLLLARVLKEMHLQPDGTRRYDLRCIGESLLDNYREMNREKTEELIERQTAVQKIGEHEKVYVENAK